MLSATHSAHLPGLSSSSYNHCAGAATAATTATTQAVLLLLPSGHSQCAAVSVTVPGWLPTAPAVLLHSPWEGTPSHPTPTQAPATATRAGASAGAADQSQQQQYKAHKNTAGSGGVNNCCRASSCQPLIKFRSQKPSMPAQPLPALTGPAMSRCAHSTPSLTNSFKNRAAVMLPPARPPVVDAVCVRECGSDKS